MLAKLCRAVLYPQRVVLPGEPADPLSDSLGPLAFRVSREGEGIVT